MVRLSQLTPKEAAQILRPRCILLEPTQENLKTAQAFGDIYYLFDAQSNRKSIMDTDLFTLDILSELARIHYDPNRDFIVTTGKITAVSIYIAAVASFYGVFRCLLYNAPARAYIERHLGQSEVCPNSPIANALSQE